MIRFYSLFVTDDDLLASPYVRRFNVFHDITLHRGATETISFLLQTPLSEEQYKNLNVIYDPLTIYIKEVEVKSFKHQSLITMTLSPKEIGSVRLGFAFPQNEYLHRTQMKKIHSPLTSVPCTQLSTHATESETRHETISK